MTEEERRERKREQGRRFRERNPGYMTSYGRAQLDGTETPSAKVDGKCRPREADWARPPKPLEERVGARRGGHVFTLGLVAALKDFQSGRCAICSIVFPTEGNLVGKQAADHCHETDAPRGILCTACNVALGLYEKRQRPAGLVLEPYESYLENTPFMRSGLVNPHPVRRHKKKGIPE